VHIYTIYLFLLLRPYKLELDRGPGVAEGIINAINLMHASISCLKLIGGIDYLKNS
jgi:hypothetical protein